jgi:hypothetical protein
MTVQGTMSRRVCLAALVVGGCSSKSSKGPTNKLPGSYSRSDRPRTKGPQTMGRLMFDSYVKDLDSPSPQSRVRAATELGNMGADAKAALPKLEKLAGDKDKAVSTAAKQAIQAIRRK